MKYRRLIEDKNRRGFALVAALATVLILGSIAAGLTTTSSQSGLSAQRDVLRMKAKLAAEGAVESAIAAAKTNPNLQKFSAELALIDDGGEKLTATYELTKAKASQFGKALENVNEEAELWYVKANAKSRRGEKLAFDVDITAILRPGPNRVRVLVWTLN